MLRITVTLSLWLLYYIRLGAGEESPETDFHRTVASWQSLTGQNDWSPWHTFCNELWQRFLSTPVGDRLDIIGAFEEAILVIEQAIFKQGQGNNQVRDVALSKLYTTYAKALASLEPNECLALAVDPHTLLIGAETADTNKPSTQLCLENAENSLRNAASLDATNKEAETLIAGIIGKENTVHQRKPKEFVAELFDSFADTFDEKLLKTLEYKVPALVGELAKSMSTGYSAVLDAGCGTGLAGRYIRPLVPDGIIIGVDASQKMLDQAMKCTRTSGCGLEVQGNEDEDSSPLYDGLVKMDLEEMTVDSLTQATKLKGITGFDFIVAADVLVYFGNLDNLLRTFATISTSRGRLIFSCELATDEEAPLGWRLLANGRFAHTKKHAINSANAVGYQLLHYDEITPRMERGEPVRGHLFAFEMNDSNRKLEL